MEAKATHRLYVYHDGHTYGLDVVYFLGSSDSMAGPGDPPELDVLAGEVGNFDLGETRGLTAEEIEAIMEGGPIFDAAWQLWHEYLRITEKVREIQQNR